MEDDLQLDAEPLVLGHWNAALGHAVTFADLLAETPFDAEDRPPAGTECAQCRMFGHWCPAKGYCGAFALCLPCGGGFACDQLAAVDRMHQAHMGVVADEELFVPDAFAGSSAGRSIEISDADRIVVERPLETAWTAKASLDPENLRKGLTRKARVPMAPRTEIQRRDAARDKSLGRRIVRAQKVAVIEKVKEGETMELKEKVCRCGCGAIYTPTSNVQKYADGHKPAKPGKLCACGCGESFTAKGAKLYIDGHKPVLAKAVGGQAKKLKPVAKPKASSLSVIPAATADDAVEMVTVRVPASALDRLILLLPAAMKAKAIEKLLVELG